MFSQSGSTVLLELDDVQTKSYLLVDMLVYLYVCLCLINSEYDCYQGFQITGLYHEASYAYSAKPFLALQVVSNAGSLLS